MDEQIVLIRRGNRAHDIGTRIQIAGPRNLGSISSKEARHFLFFKLSKPVLGPTKNSNHRYMADYFRRRKLSGCEVDHWLRFSVEIRNDWSYASIPPYVFISRNFITFTFIILFSEAGNIRCSETVKIPRPMNAFMVFSNEWRQAMACLYEEKDNTKVSKR
jgi:hypothetical protein